MNDAISQTIDEIAKVLKGKEHQIRLALACVFAEGHLLLEDLPGMGKTTLSAAIAKVSGLRYNRVQFTSDMLPADILGASIFEKDSGSFRFVKGPIFTQVLLADEINRTTPKTQSALLEAMSERQISIEGQTYLLEKPFFVIATQNPVNQHGTFPLPESQLDRFLMRIDLGYPDAQSERALLKGEAGRSQLEHIPVCMSAERLEMIQEHVRKINVSEALLDYVQRLIEFTRQNPKLEYGISPRGALALLDAAKAWAMIHKREFVVPEDIQSVLKPVFLHRLLHAAESHAEADVVIETMLREVPVS